MKRPQPALRLNLLKRLYWQSPGVVSTQIPQKYCNVTLKELKLPAQHVRSQFDLYDQLEVVQAGSTIILAGVNLHPSRSVTFFDAIALSSALAEGCNVI